MDLLRWLRAEWDRVVGFGLIALGGLLLALGYRGVSGSPYVAEQLAYIISGGVGGLFLLGVGATLLISADLHDEWRKLDRIEAAIRGEAADVEEDGGRPGPETEERLDLSVAEPEPAAAAGDGRGGRGRGPRVSAASVVSPSPAAGNPASRAHALALASPPAAGAAVTGFFVAAAVITMGWWRAAGETDPRPAIDGLSVAVSGLIAAGLVVAGYTLSLRRRVSGRGDRLFAPYLIAELAAAVRPLLPARARPRPLGAYLAVPGLGRFHKDGCPALASLDAVPVTREEADRRGLAGCGICGAA